MKQRYAGRVNGDNYEVLEPGGGVVRQIPLGEARQDSKLAASIKRNGWEAIPDE
jgi:hypothetical protein